MSDGDLTNYLPSWAEPMELVYLVSDDYEEPGPGEVKLKNVGPNKIEIKSTPQQVIRVLFKIERGGENWRFSLSWMAKMFNCFRLNMDFQEDRIVMTGEVMHAGKRTPGRMTMIKQDDDTTRFEFNEGFAFLDDDFWVLSKNKPDWLEEDDDDW